jgi:hypothetical protein
MGHPNTNDNDLALTSSRQDIPTDVMQWKPVDTNPTKKLNQCLHFLTSCREMGHPNTNDDDLAPLLRDKLMPLRMWWLKSMPGAMKQMRNALEHKKLGAPGGP